MSFHTWLSSSSVRHFPLSPPRRRRTLAVDAALNEQFSFQAAVRQDGEPGRTVRLEVAAPAGWSVRVRRVGYVPLLHHNTPVSDDPLDVDGVGRIPGYAPDPLFDADALFLPDGETHAFWVTVRPGRAAVPGCHELAVCVIPDDRGAVRHTVAVRLHNVALERRRGFPITHWFYVDSLIDWYQTDLFDRRFWKILRAYIENVVEHGQDTLYVPVFTPPLDGVKRPSQLLRVSRTGEGKYRFDWRDVRRYVRLAKACGITHFEWCHPFTQWGCKNAIRIYEGQGAGEKLLWPPDTGAASETYRDFLGQYLPKLRRFLEAEGIERKSFFHVSDEPHGEEHLASYRQARDLLRELAPWMKVMDALSGIEYARQGVTDMPIPSIRVAGDFLTEGITSWCYYCCGPRGEYLNRLMDTPLAKIAMHGLLFYRWPFKGFLHWGYNYWYESQTRRLIDPYTVQDGLRWEKGWAYGDTSVVYPGQDGPVDSIRWEVFGESLQDYQLLQTLAVDRDDPLLKPIRSFSDFPKAEAWRRRLRRRMLERYGASDR
ncbi:DUF4091 domain-containing protein [bacterium]|nr:DUF4091 domain-containing protein [bacterium]